MMLKNENVQKIMEKSSYRFDDLCLILEILRGEGGCPWDAEQTHESIRKNFIEETYEVIEAIDNKDVKLLREELGDVMLQVVFHAQMERERGTFDIDDVANDVCVKLIHRHPHIFGEVSASTTEEVLSNWEAIKNEEKKRVTLYDKLSSIPSATPALMRSSKVAKKSGAYDGLTSEEILLGLREAIDGMLARPETVDSETVGRMLFDIGALSAKIEIDPEEALFKRTNAFIGGYMPE